jgi:replicative DNA helicase
VGYSGDSHGVAELHVTKQRNGPLGVVPVQFNAPTTRFRDLSRYTAPAGY